MYGTSQWAYGGSSSSYWRPDSPVRIFHGTHDRLYDTQYDSATDTFPANPSSLGGSPSRFPSASCPAGLSADALAECQADGQALQFMNSRL